MKMSGVMKPKIIQRFEHLLWANSPKEWIFKSTYFQGTLFVSMLIEISDNEQFQKIRRSFTIDTIRKSETEKDLWGLAGDCIDEMKTEVKN